MTTSLTYLPDGLPVPAINEEGLSAPYWQGLRNGVLMVQHCAQCGTWQFGPEWICHRCHAFDPPFQQVVATGRVFSWQRVWHASHPALASCLPYLVVLVEMPELDCVRMVGNLLGDPMQEPIMGALVVGEFEQHAAANPPYALLQWRLADE